MTGNNISRPPPPGPPPPRDLGPVISWNNLDVGKKYYAKKINELVYEPVTIIANNPIPNRPNRRHLHDMSNIFVVFDNRPNQYRLNLIACKNLENNTTRDCYLFYRKHGVVYGGKRKTYKKRQIRKRKSRRN